MFSLAAVDGLVDLAIEIQQAQHHNEWPIPTEGSDSGGLWSFQP